MWCGVVLPDGTAQCIEIEDFTARGGDGRKLMQEPNIKWRVVLWCCEYKESVRVEDGLG